MDSVTTIMTNLIKNAAEANKAVAGDYIGEDGLLYCGKCKTPKQCVLSSNIFDGDGELKVGCMCDCAAEEERCRKQREEENKRRENITRLRQICFSGLRERLANAAFANDDGSNPKITKIAKRYADNFAQMRKEGQGILFYGSVGRGKSFTAACIANAVLEQNIPVLMTSFGRIVAQLQQNFDDRHSYYEWLNSFPLLIIDDFGAERGTEYMQEIIYTVIDNRYESNRPMIITTNLDAESIRRIKESDLFHQRIFGRINECCIGIEVNGENRREKLARDNFKNAKELLGV